MTRVRVQTPSRLHFGLLGWGPSTPRQFGGIGLMIEAPAIEVVAEPAADWEVEGQLVERSRRVVEEARRRLAFEPHDLHCPAARIRVVQAPPEHIGLGVGTQLSLALVRVLLELSGVLAPTIEILATLANRGLRSGIGLHGFQNGGLIVDGGRGDATVVPPLLCRVNFPEEWSILVIQPPGPPGRHGADEVNAFSQLPPPPDRVAERLCRLVLLGILPAVAERDLRTFGAALRELQHHVGGSFASTQGGVYASPRSGIIVDELARQGLVGVGQSSWGPTLYAFGIPDDPEQRRITAHLSERLELDPRSMTWTRAANHGARTEVGFA